MTRAVVLVDGEHYPPVLRDALGSLEDRGYQVVAAVLLGGGEKLAGPLDLGEVPVLAGAGRLALLAEAVATFAPEVVLDLSDAPVVTTRDRFLLASVALAGGARYQGADFRFEPPSRPRIAKAPSIAVVGTGKRTGKTAVAAFLAREAAGRGRRPVIVAMGRGGPAEPVVVRGDEGPPGTEELLELARRGEHAASDFYEDAVTARVATVGARRAGAGLAGAPFADNVARAVEAANALSPDLLVLEGSGTAVPPVAADATLLVVGGATPDLGGGLGAYRILIADLIVVTMVEEPVLSAGTSQALASLMSELARDVPIVRTVFRPTPLGSVRGRRVFFATTAPEAAGPALRRHLEEVHGAHVVEMTHNLADRTALTQDMARAEGSYEVLLMELKAAAVDVAARAALSAGAEVVVADNETIAVEGDLRAELARLEELAAKRFEAHV